MRGKNLIENLVASSGLPECGAHSELTRLIDSSGKCAQDITLDELREILAEYLQEVLLSSKKILSRE